MERGVRLLLKNPFAFRYGEADTSGSFSFDLRWLRNRRWLYGRQPTLCKIEQRPFFKTFLSWALSGLVVLSFERCTYKISVCSPLLFRRISVQTATIFAFFRALSRLSAVLAQASKFSTCDFKTASLMSYFNVSIKRSMFQILAFRE